MADLSARAGKRWIAALGDPTRLPRPAERLRITLEQGRRWTRMAGAPIQGPLSAFPMPFRSQRDPGGLRADPLGNLGLVIRLPEGTFVGNPTELDQKSPTSHRLSWPRTGHVQIGDPGWERRIGVVIAADGERAATLIQPARALDRLIPEVAARQQKIGLGARPLSHQGVVIRDRHDS